MKSKFILLILVFGFLACEDVVDIPLKNSDPILTVDAWLVNTSDTQSIVLTYSRPYFDNGSATPVLGADVSIQEKNSGQVYTFNDSKNSGSYSWISTDGSSFGQIGETYVLEISHDGVIYQSVSTMDSVPAIDSITFEYNAKDAFFTEDWYYGEFWARDLPGLGNTYWIKSFKNNQYLRQPSDINLAYDAAFSSGGEVDGLIFIQPIRTSITPFIDNETSPYKIGDTVRVELYSISEDAWFFLTRVIDETSPQPGFAQLFANPLANVPTNISSSSEKAAVVGFFSVAAVSVMEEIVDESSIVDRIPD